MNGGTTAQRRGTKASTANVKSSEGSLFRVVDSGGPDDDQPSSTTTTTNAGSESHNSSNSGRQEQQQPKQQQHHHLLASNPPAVATVRRRFCGTGPFDRNWLCLDFCGLFCALFTYFLHGFGVHAVCFILLPPWMSTTISNSDGGGGDVVHGGDELTRSLTTAGMFHTMAFPLVAMLAVISHFKAMTTDPGAVPPDATPVPEASDADGEKNEMDGLTSTNALTTPKVRRLCRRCKAFKPQRAHHCSVCNRCIIKMDHHCPWVNNCVGIGNHKYFLLFVAYTFVSCLYSLVLVVARFTTCVGDHYRHYHHHRHPDSAITSDREPCLDDPSQLLNILGLLIEGLLFGMFTCCMMFDQFDVIQSKITHIDRLKGADVGGSLSGVAEVFGVGFKGLESRFRVDWISPFAQVCFPPSVRDEVMGFCRPMKKRTCSKIDDLEVMPLARQVREV